MKKYLIIVAVLAGSVLLALGLSRLEGFVLPIHPFGNTYYIKRVPYLSSVDEDDLMNQLGE